MQNIQPVNVGDVINVKVDAIGTKKDGTPGDGIARIKKFVLFIKDGLPDDEYKVKVTQVGPKFGRAEIIQNL